MEATPIRNLFNLPASTPQAATAVGGALGRDQFLQLLTVQLKYQDPLNPVSNTEFTSQLAEFSALEQMEQINDTLQSDLMVSESVHNAIATSMIGRSVTVLGDEFEIADPDEGPPAIYAEPGAAGQATVAIRDASGALVRTLIVDLESGAPQRIEWDGRDANGDRLAAGLYSFEVTQEDGDGNATSALTYVEGTVSTLRFEDGVTQLLLGSVPYTLADVVEIRA